MSGGSYNYLFVKSAQELHEYEQELESMAARLAGLGYAEDAARETEETLLILRQAHIRLQTRIDRLTHVWRSIEWWDSRDSGEENVQAALARYRGEKTS